MTEANDEGRGDERRPGPSGHLEADRDAPWRSLLFFPGTRADQYSKALASGADLVCLDLEDAVGPGDKESARQHMVALLGSSDWVWHRSAVRLNPVRSDQGRRDLEGLAAAGTSAAIPAGAARPPRDSGPIGRRLTVLLPKVSDPGEVDEVGRRLEEVGLDVRIVAMIETAHGLEEVMAVARAPRVAALFLGAVDLATELGCALEWDALLHARSRVVHASAVGGVQSIDVPFLDLQDVAGLEEEARAVARLGFTGKAAIHPRQVGTIHAALAPTVGELARARRILEANARGTGGVSVFEDRMIDRPVVEAARRTLARERKDD